MGILNNPSGKKRYEIVLTYAGGKHSESLVMDDMSPSVLYKFHQLYSEHKSIPDVSINSVLKKYDMADKLARLGRDIDSKIASDGRLMYHGAKRMLRIIEEAFNNDRFKTVEKIEFSRAQVKKTVHTRGYWKD